MFTLLEERILLVNLVVRISLTSNKDFSDFKNEGSHSMYCSNTLSKYTLIFDLYIDIFEIEIRDRLYILLISFIEVSLNMGLFYLALLLIVT